jgi:Fic family protein
VRAGLAHVQFETIHPFLDGNGRVGRLLIALLLFETKVLSQPLLYLSLYLKEHRAEYYRLLDAVRREGDWEEWIDFFLEGVTMTAQSAVDTAHRMLRVFEEDAARVADLGRRAPNALRAFDAFRRRPVRNIAAIAATTGASLPTVSRAVESLVELGIVREITGRKRERAYCYGRYLEILNGGTVRAE